MNLPLFNIFMATLIAVIIGVIAAIKNPKLKSLVYSLPIPITLTLIATQKKVDGTHVVGLALLTGFLYLTSWLMRRFNNIWIADIVAAIAYTAVGYILVKGVPDLASNILLLSAGYFVFWVLVVFYPKKPKKRPVPPRSRVNPALKGAMVFPLAYLLLLLKNILQGVVVTFPYSGVFAVYEMRHELDILAYEFAKNSLAILVLLLIVYYAADSWGFYPAIIASWVGYIATQLLVRNLIRAQ